MVPGNNFTVSIVPWESHSDTLIAIRRVVFIDEQNVSEAEEIDGLDDQHTHALCLDQQTGAAIGCARISDTGKIGRMAVIKQYRGLGVGAAIMEFCNQTVLTQGLEPYLDAQVDAIDFYRKLGYETKGKVFMDANIPHKRMVYRAQADNTKTQRPIQSLEQTLSNSSRDLYICCPVCLAPWLASPQIVSALKQAFVNGRARHLAIIFDEKDPDCRRFSSILELSKRLSSKVSLRCSSDQGVVFEQLSVLNNHTLWRAPVPNSKTEPEQYFLEKLSDQQRQIKHEEFLRLWDHQTWDNPNLREIFL